MLRTQLQSFRGQTDGTYESRTLMGREYLVVPVVAMVEGVRFGANQENAELGLASEFGKFVDGWNNSPVVLGHPKVDDNFVSASSPSVLEEYQIGFMSGSLVADKKLKCEAWLDKSQLDKSDAAVSVKDRVEAGEMIEVSVGFFCEVEEKRGTFKGQKYAGVWRNIVPDHLAFLEEGVLGACSIADGCGTPRVNETTEKEEIMFRADKSKKDKKKDTTNMEGEHACSCQNAGVTQATNDETPSTQMQFHSLNVLAEGVAKKDARALEVLQQLVTMAAPENMLSSDVYSLLSSALQEQMGDKYYVYLYGFTAKHALYAQYDDGEWCMLRLEYSISDVGVVTFTGEPQEVRLITNIIPVESGEGDGVTTNESQPEETSMTDTTQENAPGNQTVETAAPKEPAVNAAPAAPKALSAAEYIAEAPAEVREVLEQSMKVHNDRKNLLINKIKESGRNKFDDAYLTAQSLNTLESLVSLASVEVDYSAQGGGVFAPKAQEAGESAVPKAPVALVRKTQA